MAARQRSANARRTFGRHARAILKLAGGMRFQAAARRVGKFRLTGFSAHALQCMYLQQRADPPRPSSCAQRCFETNPQHASIKRREPLKLAASPKRDGSGMVGGVVPRFLPPFLCDKCVFSSVSPALRKSFSFCGKQLCLSGACTNAHRGNSGAWFRSTDLWVTSPTR